jgi:hypothetical protein
VIQPASLEFRSSLTIAVRLPCNRALFANAEDGVGYHGEAKVISGRVSV